MKASLFLFLICFKVSFCQSDERGKHIIGFRMFGYILNTTVHHPIGKSNTIDFRIEPYYLYPINKVFSIGVLAEYNKGWTSSEYVDIPDVQYGVGFVGRWNYPNPFTKDWMKDRLSFFSELSYSITNSYNSEAYDFHWSDRGQLKYTLWRFRPIGANFRIYKNLEFDFSVCVYKFVPGRWRTMRNIGLSYNF